MGIVLVGEPETRRTEYFLRAARELHKSVRFVDWQQAGIDLACSLKESKPTMEHFHEYDQFP